MTFCSAFKRTKLPDGHSVTHWCTEETPIRNKNGLYVVHEGNHRCSVKGCSLTWEEESETFKQPLQIEAKAKRC